jgi:hypothetical protein
MHAPAFVRLCNFLFFFWLNSFFSGIDISVTTYELLHRVICHKIQHHNYMKMSLHKINDKNIYELYLHQT